MAKKASVKISGVGDAKRNALKFLNDTAKDKDFLQSIADLTVKQIVARTRGRQEEYKQPDLKPITKAAREVYLQNFGGKGDLSKPNTSNLTLSGQLLDALTSKVNQATAEIVVFLKDERYSNTLSKTRAEIIKGTKFTGNKSKNKLLGISASLLSKEKPKKTNNEIQQDLEDKGRRFLFLSDRLNSLLESKIAQELRRKLSIYNRIKRKLSL